MPGTVLGAGYTKVKQNRAGLQVIGLSKASKIQIDSLKSILLFKKMPVCRETSINLNANYFQFNPT